MHLCQIKDVIFWWSPTFATYWYLTAANLCLQSVVHSGCIVCFHKVGTIVSQVWAFVRVRKYNWVLTESHRVVVRHWISILQYVYIYIYCTHAVLYNAIINTVYIYILVLVHTGIYTLNIYRQYTTVPLCIMSFHTNLYNGYNKYVVYVHMRLLSTLHILSNCYVHTNTARYNMYWYYYISQYTHKCKHCIYRTLGSSHVMY